VQGIGAVRINGRNKEVAQTGARLLRFGAPVFEAIVQAANARLVALKDEVRAEYPGDEAIAPVPVSELALAWVRAV
jgi:hypothetical protein